MENPTYASVLKEYFTRYLIEVRGVEKSVKHYTGALNSASERLKELGIVENDIFELSDINDLKAAVDILRNDEFAAKDSKGHNMYSVGLNHYLRFAEGEGFAEAKDKIALFDAPIAPGDAIATNQTSFNRSNILRLQAIEFAGYSCEMDNEHKTFIAEATQKPYMEGHHAMPMNLQGSFDVSLDVYANIICLCPLCHRRIHYGIKNDRKDMISQIYDKRSERLAHSGIYLSKDEFIGKAIG